jgi:hypothetical protein
LKNCLVVELLAQVIQLELGHQRGRETALKVEVGKQSSGGGAPIRVELERGLYNRKKFLVNEKIITKIFFLIPF